MCLSLLSKISKIVAHQTESDPGGQCDEAGFALLTAQLLFTVKSLNMQKKHVLHFCKNQM